MEKKCKNRKCQRPLPDGYKYKYCENCKSEHAEQLKKAGKAVVGVIGSAVLVVIRKRKS